MGHINIPVFIPHLGCPNQCIFCNQRYISGMLDFDEKMVEMQILEVLDSINQTDVEIAFFGGSFTGIDRNLMIRLLDIAQKYVDAGRVAGIRMSTRPDYINEEIIEILKKYTISFVELGIQTVNDDLLRFLKRGHTRQQTINAINLLKKNGFYFIGQMMIGLPNATIDDEIECAQFICRYGASGVRIYPTIVFKETELATLVSQGVYEPLTLEDAVDRSAEVLDIFVKNKIPCIRIGLCESENLHSEISFVAGPNHPSIGEMVKSKLYFRNISSLFDKMEKLTNIVIFCPIGAKSQVIGNRKTNILRLKKIYGLDSIQVFEKNGLNPYDIEIKNKED